MDEAGRPGHGPRMKKNVGVDHVMSKDLVTIHPGEPLSRVRELFTEHSLHHLPVVSGDQLVGIISWTDLMRLSFGDAFGEDDRAVDAVLDHSLTLEGAMTKDPVTIDVNAGVHEAAKILAEKDFHALPVVKDGGRLVGIVTTSDLLKFLLKFY